MSLPVSWMSAGVPTNILHCDTVCPFPKGLHWPQNWQTAGALKTCPWGKFTKMSIIVLSGRTPLSPTPLQAQKKCLGRLVQKIFHDFNMLNPNISLA